MGALAESVSSIAQLEQAIKRAKSADRSYLIAIDTDPYILTDNGDSWWDVAIPEVSVSDKVATQQQNYQQHKNNQPY